MNVLNKVPDQSGRDQQQLQLSLERVSGQLFLCEVAFIEKGQQLPTKVRDAWELIREAIKDMKGNS